MSGISSETSSNASYLEILFGIPPSPMPENGTFDPLSFLPSSSMNSDSLEGRVSYEPSPSRKRDLETRDWDWIASALPSNTEALSAWGDFDSTTLTREEREEELEFLPKENGVSPAAKRVAYSLTEEDVPIPIDSECSIPEETEEDRDLLLQSQEFHRRKGEPGKMWTSEEEAIIEKYISKGAKWIHEHHLKHRSVIAIRLHCRSLGHGSRVNSSPWKPEEDAIIRTHVQIGGFGIHKRGLLLDRAVYAIDIRIKELGLTREIRVRNDWSEEEDALLVAHENASMEKLLEIFPDRTMNGIKHRRKALKLPPIAKKGVWTDGEIAVLKEFAKLGAEAIAKRRLLPGRTEKSILGKLYELRLLKGTSALWSKEEVEYLERCLDLTPSQIHASGNLLNRTERAIREKKRIIECEKRRQEEASSAALKLTNGCVNKKGDE